MKAEVNRGQLLNKFKAAQDFIDDAKKATLQKAAEWVVLRSPVDTGTYMENHNIGSGNSVPPSGSQSSTGKPRNQDYNQYAEKALARTFDQIEKLPEDWKRASIGNTSFHVEEVEYTHGYGVFTSLRAAWPQLKQEAVAEAEARSRL